MKDLIIERAQLSEIKEISRLFNDYRKFYKAESDLNGSIHFLTERLDNNESVIFFASLEGVFVGFVQMFPLFSSVSMTRVYVLNDLYVAEKFRGNGIATHLIKAAIDFATDAGCSKISLSTAADNPAQKLYEEIGFKLSTFKFYNFSLVKMNNESSVLSVPAE